MTLVFVYGSLLEGLFNNYILAEGGATLVKRTFTTERFKMYDLGGFPACTPDAYGTLVHGEVYEVDDATLEQLDQLEGYRPGREPHFYDRITVHVGGKMHALMYVVRDGQRLQNKETVASGDWRPYYQAKRNRSLPGDFTPAYVRGLERKRTQR